MKILQENPDLLEALNKKRNEPSLLNSLTKNTLKKEYNQELRSFSMCLAFYSTRAYKFVRSELNDILPHISTIRRWHQKVDGSPGFTLSAIPIIKQKIKAALEKQKTLTFSLIMDEVHLAHKLQTDKGDGRNWGYEDYGVVKETPRDSKKFAKEALVFLITCDNERWKIPVAYFLIDSLKAPEKANVVLEVNVFKFFKRETLKLICFIVVL